MIFTRATSCSTDSDEIKKVAYSRIRLKIGDSIKYEKKSGDVYEQVEKAREIFRLKRKKMRHSPRRIEMQIHAT